jgi:ribosomal protein S18 acetylase RimI-like enzyme
MTKLLLRTATPEDIPSIVRACLTSSTKEEAKGFAADEWVTYSSPEELRKVWARENRLKEGSEVIVAVENGKLVGFIVFKEERDSVYIDDIDITKDEQRKGIGRALVTHVENIAVAKGYSVIKTDTTENVEGVLWKSYGFWTGVGYKDTGERLPTRWSFKTVPFVKHLKARA